MVKHAEIYSLAFNNVFGGSVAKLIMISRGGIFGKVMRRRSSFSSTLGSLVGGKEDGALMAYYGRQQPLRKWVRPYFIFLHRLQLRLDDEDIPSIMIKFIFIKDHYSLPLGGQ